MLKKLVKLLCLAAAALCILAACNTQQPVETTEAPIAPEDRIYWNVDRELYNTLKKRGADPDTGLYTVRFAADGEIFEFQTDRGEIVEFIDQERVVGLTFTEDGKIFGMKGLTSFAGGYAAENKLISSIEGDTYYLEGKSGAKSITITPDTKIYDVSGVRGELGSCAELEVGDYIYAIRDKETNIILVYITDHVVPHDNHHECVKCNEVVEWVAWDGKTEVEDGGHYYLEKDVYVHHALELAGKEITLCLDSHNYKSGDCAVVLSEGAQLNIIDHKIYNGSYKGYFKGAAYSVKNPSYEAFEGGTIRIMDNTSAVNIYGGNLMTEVPADGSRKVSYGGTIHSFGTINLYDGSIIGCEVVGTGGAVYLDDGAVLNMAGGTLMYGTALVNEEKTEHKTGRGGTLYVKKTAAEVNFLGGTVVAGTAQYGGGIFTELSFDLVAGTFTGDLTTGDNAEYGGVITVGGSSTMNIKSGVEFYGGHAIEGGHIACLHGSVVNIYDGVTFRKGTASRNGGHIANFGTVNIYGGSFTEGTASGGGGNIYMYSNGTTEMHISGGTISGGVASRGGNVMVSSGRGKKPAYLYLYDGALIENGTATGTKGGNIDLRRDAVMVMTGGLITGGDGGGVGDGVYMEPMSTDYPEHHVVVKLGGDAKITGNGNNDLQVNSGGEVLLIEDAPFSATATIGVDHQDFMKPFLADCPTDISYIFTCQNPDCNMVWKDGQLWFEFKI